MKLIKFDSTNSKSSRSGEPTIRFNKSTGVISISQKFVEAIGLKASATVSIIQDEDTPEDWFLFVNDPDGFSLREEKNGYGLSFNNSFVSKSLIESLDDDNSKNIISVGFKLATEKADKPEDDEIKMPKNGALYAFMWDSIIIKYRED